MEDAVNPQHPVTRALEGQWFKLLAIVLHKLGVDTVEITDADVDTLRARFADTHGPAVVADGRHASLIVRLVSLDEARAISRAERKGH